MKKLIIAALISGLILFIWQFISFAAINIHTDTQQYSPNQDKILEFLDQNLEEGFYFLPNAAPGEDEMEAMEKAVGKPWAQVYFHKKMTNSMGFNLLRGLLIDIISGGLLAWILLKMGNPSFQTILISSLAVGIIGYLNFPYLNSIWYEIPTKMDLVDAVVSWGLVGFWLSWWLRK
jgi:hypothetical protein